MKIMVTGASGMLGTDLCQIFCSGYETVGVDMRPAIKETVAFRQIDLSDPQAVQACVLDEKPDVIFHAAAMTDVDGCESRRDDALKGNVEVTRNLVDASNQVESLILFMSTDYVFDGKKKGEYTEDDEPRPQNFYGETKFLAEKYIREKARHYAIFRISWLYGVNGRSFPRTILEKSKTVELFKVVCDQVGRPTYTRDIGNAFYRLFSGGKSALDRMDHEIFHLTNRGQCSWAEFAVAILKAGGRENVRVEFVDGSQVKRPAIRPANSVLSFHKSQEKLGLRLRSWEEAIREFVSEMEGSGALQ